MIKPFHFILILALMLSSCESSISSSSGLIIKDISFGECLDYYRKKDGAADFTKKIIIYNSDEYNQFLNDVEIDSLKCNIPKIDFTRFTMIGMAVKHVGCEVAFKKNFEILSSKEAVYVVKRVAFGDCKSTTFSMNYVLVPKLNPKTEVVFKIEETFFDSYWAYD